MNSIKNYLAELIGTFVLVLFACGTAAVISPIGGIQNGEDFHVFYSETEVGPQTKALYDQLTGIQFGDIAAPTGWIFDVPLK